MFADRAPDRDRPVAVEHRIHAVPGGTDGGLGRPVGVDIGKPAGKPQRLVGPGRLARGDQQLQRIERRVVELGEIGRRQGRDRHLVPAQIVGEGERIANPVRPGDHQRGAVQQRHQHFPDRGIERGRGELQHPMPGLDAQAQMLGGRQVDRAAMLQHHALGLAGRAGGVDQIGRIAGSSAPRAAPGRSSPSPGGRCRACGAPRPPPGRHAPPRSPPPWPRHRPACSAAAPRGRSDRAADRPPRI